MPRKYLEFLHLLPAAVLAIFAGLLNAASMATPWDREPSGWMQLLALTLLVWQLQRCQKASRAAWLGWLFATAWLAGTFWWLFVSMHSYAGLAAWIAATAVLALAASLALYFAAAAATFAILRPANRVGAAALFAALWMLAELARGVWFTGFGWGATAYAHLDGLAAAAQYVGAYGVGLLAAFVAALIGVWIQGLRPLHRQWPLTLSLLVSAVMVWAPGSFTTPGATLQVALLQGNIAQDVKFQPGTGVPDALRWYGDQMQRSSATLVIAPETAIALLPEDLPEGYWSALRARFGSGPQAALLGVPLRDAGDGYTNSVVGFKPGPQDEGALASYRYDKHHLVPFGEFIPTFFRWFTQMMNIPLGDFARGAVGQPSFEWQGQRLAPNVCYEDLFGEELGARFVDPAQAPTIFVNVSNIGWFGDTVAIAQHLSISRMRALEFGRAFIRATNTGQTAIIDHTGRVTHTLARYTRGVLLGQVQGRNGITPFAWWVARFGLWPLWLLGSMIVLAALLARSRRLRLAP